MSTATLSGPPQEVQSVAYDIVRHTPPMFTYFDPTVAPSTRELGGNGAGSESVNDREEAAESTIWSFVSRLADDLGADSILELLEDFTEQTPLRLVELRRIAGLVEWQVVLQRGAHSLKGSSSIFGLTNLERAAQRLEHLASDRLLSAQAHQVLVMEREFSRTRPVLETIKRRLQTGYH